MLKNLDEEKKKRSRLEDERNEMLSDISHDLKTPITVIRGYTKALKDGVIEENERSRVYDTIDTKASYLGSLIDQFAEYSKLDHPQFHYDKKLVEIRELMREIMTIILITHSRELAEECPRIITLSDGNIVRDAGREQIC